MVFTEPYFLFAFFPVVYAAYWLVPRRAKLAVLLLSSLAFYTQGEGIYVALMLVSVTANFALAGRIADTAAEVARRRWLQAALAINLALLIAFKYANLLADSMDGLARGIGLPTLDLPPVHLPIGISFFTFQAMSYVIDVYRRDVEAARSWPTLGAYIAFFPQLIAGPIVRYETVAARLADPRVTSPEIAQGIRRFIVGLAQKLLLANPAGAVADQVFGVPANELTAAAAWMGAVAYTLQIYFDFCGYSGMAIGIGRMFGFEFPENFNFPYISKSITEFWRRWHMTLSGWFRDYLYIPLGGNRRGSFRTYANLVIVFALCGLWHGASWTFIAWGLYHGFFLVLERAGLSDRLARLPALVQHVYTMLAVVFGWVLFRAESFEQALGVSGAMLGFGSAGARYDLTRFVTVDFTASAIAAVFFATPFFAARAWTARPAAATSGSASATYVPLSSPAAPSSGLRDAILLGLFFLCIVRISTDSHDPFIYFRF